MFDPSKMSAAFDALTRLDQLLEAIHREQRVHSLLLARLVSADDSRRVLELARRQVALDVDRP